MANAPFTLRYDDQGVFKYLEQFGKDAQQEFVEMMHELGKIGEESMRDSVRTRGTAWSAFRKSKWNIGKSWAGRIKSGALMESIGSRPRFGDKIYQIEVGYIKNKQDYFAIQDSGFKNIWTSNPNGKFPFFFKRKTPITTEGIHALRDARQAMKDSEDRLTKRTINRLKSRGINIT